MPAQHDRVLADAYLSGQKWAHACIHTSIFTVIRYSTWNLHDQEEDIAQDVHVALVTILKNKEFRWDCSLNWYVKKITLNKCISLRRSYKLTVSIDDSENPIVIRDPKPGPLETVMANEHDEIFEQIMDAASPRCRDLFRLRLHEHLKYREIASLTETPINTIKVRLKRCIDKAKTFYRGMVVRNNKPPEATQQLERGSMGMRG